jgi:hypothetical protein
MEVLNFATPKWVYMFKSLEKRLCKSWKYQSVAGYAILNYSAILKFWKKNYFYDIFVFKLKVSEDLNESWMNSGTFVSSGHLEFLHHFDVLFLKIHSFYFLWSRLPKYVIRLNLNLIAHEMTMIDIPSNVSFSKQSYC